MCKCGNIAAAPLFTHYYKQKTAEKQVIGGKSAVDKGKFFCGRPWSQIVELSTVFPFPSPARAEEFPRSARRRADFYKLSRKSPKLSTKRNICTARCEGKSRSLCVRFGGRKSPFAPLRAKKEDGFFRHRAKWLAGGGQTPQGAPPASPSIRRGERFGGRRGTCGNATPSRPLFPVAGGKGARTAVVFAVSLARRRRI